MSRTRRKKHNNKKKAPIITLVVAIAGFIMVAGAVFLLTRQPELAEQVEISGEPRLVADKDLVDFGDVKLGTNVRVDFTLTNTGDGTLLFTEKPYVELKDGC